MKISPISQGTGTPGQALGSVDVGRTANPIKLERARAIARGEKVPELEEDKHEELQPKPNTRSIKMRTQQSVYRDGSPAEVPEAPPAEPASPIPEAIEPPATEVTKPIAPQFVALAKEKRAAQVRTAALDAREKALAEREANTANPDLIARLKAQPLSVLQEHGVTYDQLTEAILNGSDAINPEIQALKAELKALKEGVDKTLGDRDTQAEQAALGEMRREAEKLARDGDAFEMVRETKSLPQVMDLIHRTYKETGEVLDVSEAMQLVEDELITESLKLATLKKVQGKLAPPPPAPLQPQQRQMRTLTARDTAAPTMSAKARAIAAFNGTLKR